MENPNDSYIVSLKRNFKSWSKFRNSLITNHTDYCKTSKSCVICGAFLHWIKCNGLVHYYACFSPEKNECKSATLPQGNHTNHPSKFPHIFLRRKKKWIAYIYITNFGLTYYISNRQELETLLASQWDTSQNSRNIHISVHTRTFSIAFLEGSF